LEFSGSGGFAVKYVAFASLVGIIASAIAMGAATDGSDAQSAFAVLACVGVAGWVVSALTWVYMSWDFLPYDFRRNRSGRAISPSEAVGLQFIPLYNLYWIFVQNLGYCDALDSLLAQTGSRERAPRSLAMTCCVVQVIPYLNWALGPFLWMAYMVATDNVKAQLRAAHAP
jgi:cyanate permease